VEEVVFEHFDDQPEVEKITFESVDTNGDGFIDTNEYVELSKHLARVFFGDYADMMPVEHWEAIGDRAISDLDTSKDLRVNREELIAGEVLVKEFVKSFQAYGEYLQSQAAGSTANGEASLLQPPEVDEVFESHGPADDDEHFQAHTEVQPMMTEGAPEDLEEFQAEAHESITDDVLKIMSPGVDSTVCAEECGALEACKAVRYFHDPEPTCVLLSHFQVDDHVHDTFTFTFLKDAHDGTVVKHVVEEIVFDSFDDQPEVGKLTFGGIDTDGNGFIDTKEYVELSKRFARIFFGEVMASAMPDSHWDPIGDRAIADLDLNGDGHISREESVAGEAFFRDFIESFREYGELLKSQSSAAGDGLLQFSPMPARS
jgi:Ca2+-binding EF-hand superfamily protein